MKIFHKRLALILSVLYLLCGVNCVYADEDSGLYSDRVIVRAEIAPVPNIIDAEPVFGLYNADKVFLGAQKIAVWEGVETRTMEFVVPQYKIGELFYLMPISGLRSMNYYTTEYFVGEYAPLATYGYLPQSAEQSGIGNEFSVTVNPFYDKPVNLYINSEKRSFKSRIKIIDDSCAVPLYEYIVGLGCNAWNVKYDEAVGRIQIDHNNKQIVFFLDTDDVLLNGTLVDSGTTVKKIGGETYIPMRFTADALGCSLSSAESDGVLNVHITTPMAPELNNFVNSCSVYSKTDYMIWISKSNFRVAVFHGSANKWNCVKYFKCSIGAPGTPTVTGQFEYFSREARWSYPTYYVGPIMRFYHGFAIHSTLLRYNGNAADGRLGMRISHGCVRVAPEDINWLVNNIPLHTKIFITN